MRIRLRVYGKPGIALFNAKVDHCLSPTVTGRELTKRLLMGRAKSKGELLMIALVVARSNCLVIILRNVGFSGVALICTESRSRSRTRTVLMCLERTHEQFIPCSSPCSWSSRVECHRQTVILYQQFFFRMSSSHWAVLKLFN